MDSKMKRVVGAASFGTMLEWYDFFLYGTAAALIFPHLFFPSTEPLVGTLLSFAVYATGFLARPLGGVISGHFGDRIGRKKTLMATLLVMGISTACIGLLPTYAQVGVWAPILLVALRIIQGLATGGEWGGASLLTLEHTKSRRAFWGSFISMAVFIGLILGNLVFLSLDALLTDEQLFGWGWRIAFLISLLMVGVGIYMRRRIDETPEFAEVKAKNERSRTPLLEALKKHPRNIIAIFLMRVGQNTSFYIIAVFCLAYAATLGMERWVTLTALLLGATAAAIACPFWGILADRIGYAKIMIGSLVVSALLAFPIFAFLESKSAVFIILMIVVAIAGVNASSDAIQPGYFTSMFGTKIRYSGVSIGREGGTIIGGGLAPIIATFLLAQTGHWWAVAAWMVITSILGLIGVFLARPIVDGASGSAEEVLQGSSVKAKLAR
jgi:MHS family shikimate/dehydroshikimate transporter-like MFS transporter